jgi:hypothetical protein
MGFLLYGFIRADDAATLDAQGPALESVELLKHGRIAAIAARTEDDYIDPTRKNLTKYADLLTDIARSITVVPMRFGVIVPAEDELVATVMEPRQTELLEMLKRFDGMVEVDVKGHYDEPSMLQAIVASDDELRALSEKIKSLPHNATYYDRISLGERVAKKISSQREQDQQRAIEALSAACTDIRANDPVTEMMALNLALLVERGRVDELAELIQSLPDKLGGRVTLKVAGPLPPFSFVDAHLPVGA